MAKEDSITSTDSGFKLGIPDASASGEGDAKRVRNRDFEVPGDATGRKMGIIGLPNSGKTSWLFSLVSGASGHALGQRSWIMGAVKTGFAAMAGGRVGDMQAATAASVFKTSRLCRMIRPWFSFLPKILPFRTSFWLVIPEVGGETVREIANPVDEHSVGKTAERYLDFLGSCESVMCFVGIDGEMTNRDDSIRPDEAISPSIMAFERILGEALGRRSGGRRKWFSWRGKQHPIVVSVLITKIDLLKQAPRLDQVEVNMEQSSVAKLCRNAGYESIEAQLREGGSDADVVCFRLSTMLASPVARGDMDLQECIAADFLRCHAPVAAKSLARLCRIEGLDVRFFLSSPYGQRFVGSTGTNIFPPPDKINPSMVYEPLEEALERSWQVRAAERTRKRIGKLAAAIILLAILGPWFAHDDERKFESAIAEGKAWTEVKIVKDQLEGRWFFRLEQEFSPSRRVAHSKRLLDFRERMLAGEVKSNDDSIVQIERETLRLDPNAEFVTAGANGRSVRASIMAHDVEWMVEFLVSPTGTPSPARSIGLSGEKVVEVCDRMDREILKGRSPEAWSNVQEQATKLRDAVVEDPEGKELQIHVRAGGDLLVNTLGRIIKLAEISTDSFDEAIVLVTPRDEVYERVELLSRVGRLNQLRLIDDAMTTMFRNEWDKNLEGVARGGSGEEIIASLNSREIPWFDYQGQFALRGSFDEWYLDQLSDQAVFVRSRIANPKPAAIRVDVLETRVGGIEKVQAFAGSLRKSGGAEVVQGVDYLIEEIVERMKNRNRILKNLLLNENLKRLREQEAQEIEAEFLSEFPSTLQYKRFDGAIAEVDLGRIGLEQRDVFNSIVSKLHQRATNEGDLEAADLALHWQKIFLIGAPETVECRLAFNEVLREIRSLDPDLSNLDSGIAGMLEGGCFSQFKEQIASELYVSPVVAEVLERLVKTKMPPRSMDSREITYQDWINEISREMPSERWAEFSREQVEMILQEASLLGADEFGRDRSGVERIAYSMLDGLQAVALSDGIDSVKSRQARGLILGVFRFFDENVTEPLAPRVALHATLASIKKDFDQSQAFEDFDQRGLDQLAALVDEGLRSPEMASLRQDVQAHLGKIKYWKLRKVENGRRSFWLGEMEWDRTDIADLARRNPEEWSVVWKSDESLQGIYGPKGVCTEHNYGSESNASLKLDDHEQAMKIVAVGGLRLPTTSELSRARGIQLDFKKGDVPGGGYPGTSPSELRAIGDINPENGIVGLSYGVREWVSDYPRPQGRSSSTPVYYANDHEIHERIKRDVGIRPALDLAPLSLSE